MTGNALIRRLVWGACHGLAFGMPRKWVTGLTYHSIGGNDPYVSVPRSDFLAQIDRLIEAGTTFVSLRDINIGEDGCVSSLLPGILLTFDDGYEDFLWVAEKLADRSIPCVVAIPACLAQGKRPLGVMMNEPMLTPSQLQQVARLPLVSIAAHGVSHSRLGNLSVEKVQAVMKDSYTMIEEAVEAAPEAIVYPYGSYNASVLAEARSIGFQKGFTINSGIITIGTPGLQLPRFCVNSYTAPDFFKLITGTGVARYLQMKSFWDRKHLVAIK